MVVVHTARTDLLWPKPIASSWVTNSEFTSGGTCTPPSLFLAAESFTSFMLLLVFTVLLCFIRTNRVRSS